MSEQGMIKVWDPLVRVFHWMLVIAFFTAYFTDEDLQTVHVYAGYTVVALVLVRLIWGVIGTRYARFKNFVTPPRVAWHYFKDALMFRGKRYIGHNPAGGAMIVLLLFFLLITTLLGLATYGAKESAGPLAGWLGHIGKSGAHTIKEVHEFFANITLTLIIIHIVGVLFESLVHGENLARAMVYGDKRSEGDTSAEKYKRGR